MIVRVSRIVCVMEVHTLSPAFGHRAEFVSDMMSILGKFMLRRDKLYT